MGEVIKMDRENYLRNLMRRAMEEANDLDVDEPPLEMPPPRKKLTLAQVNKLPTNLQARELLQAAGEGPDPRQVYAVQLVDFALHRGLIEILNPQLGEWVEKLLVVNMPGDVAKALNLGGELPEVDIATTAELILANLHDFLTEHLHGYPISTESN